MRRRYLLVVVVVVGAGCSAVPFGDADPGVAETVTPVPVPDERATATDPPTATGRLPPGVAANGTLDLAALVDAHRTVLGDQSFAWTVDFDTATGVSAPAGQQFRRQVRVDDESYLVDQTVPGPTPNRTLYVDDSGAFLRTEFGNGSADAVVVARSDYESYVFTRAALTQYLDSLTVDATTVERDGRTFYRLYSAGERPPAYASDQPALVTNYTATVYVTPEGLVRTLAVSYDRGREEMQRHVSVRYDYTEVGTTNVTRPDWVDDVPRAPRTDDETTETDAAGTDAASLDEADTATATTDTAGDGNTSTPPAASPTATATADAVRRSG
jgi:hypothetical protein